MQNAPFPPVLHRSQSWRPMPFLSVHGLSFQLPDGRILFQTLAIAFGSESTGLVGRNGARKSTLLALLAGHLKPSAGSVRGEGPVPLLRQIVDFGERETLADLFGLTEAFALLGRVEAGQASVDEITEADWTLERRFEKALADVGLDGMEPARRLASLSGGQRTRAGLAALV